MSNDFPRKDEPGASEESYIQRLLNSTYNQEKIDAELEQIRTRFVKEDRRIIWFISSILIMLVITLIIFLVYFYGTPDKLPFLNRAN
ncbi:hypothetical protein [Mucilaginibacter terrenus]|nr:hypothetical protein [Mucilaginibacter terrenus]